MENNNKIILHIVFDGILFDGVSNRFDQMEGYRNIYLLNTFGQISSFKFIKLSSKVTVAKDEEEWGKFISNSKIDFIYIHGLWSNSTKAVRYISDNAIVIWWCYGMEIYENSLGIAPILPMRIYKTRTFWLWQKKNISIHRFMSNYIAYFFPTIYNFIMRLKYPQETKDIYKMLKRVDYLFTPLENEYDELRKRNKIIKAKPFRLYSWQTPCESPIQHSRPGEILIDHSAVLSNNHTDIFHALRKIDVKERTLNIPISYGDDFMKQKIKTYESFNGSNTLFLESPIPFKDYQEMIRKCTHAIFGGIRQTGLGNIYLCLRNGVKIFMFKDSITYKYLTKTGYYVFSIEDDLSDREIKVPLSENAAMHNFNLFYKLHGVSHGTYEKQFDRLLIKE